MNHTRMEIFDDRNLSVLAKVSLNLSNRIIIQNLKEGNWLDLLSGYYSNLQRSQISNPKISKFISLDKKLDKQLVSSGIALKEISLNKKLPLTNGSFANVTIVNGLEHLWHENEILSECHRILKAGGRLQIVVPTWFGKFFLEFFAFKLGWRQEKIEMDDHKRYYDEKSLWPKLVSAGFSPSKIQIKRIKMFCSLHAMAIK